MAEFLFGLIIGLIIGAGAVWRYSNVLKNFGIAKKGASGEPSQSQAENLAGFNRQREEKMDSNESKILDLFSKKNEISNDDVQKLLGISDATAERYLQNLENQGKIKQKENAGRGVTYVRN